ncbi:uncharacterized protein FPRO_09525 [Fusarium proliferatum ET1]|uniref:Secreted protein n=1 Tax=Fusarium proliferatum (strain ET1) TaxID=1227346 RepID=A0A1L7VNZ4_FUSPR|nr:uncharacterized protein FPRO_09525 [Fusarium proliferatum ET1]CZR42223.1 uncharacterized protein FPRO_09525 [Fusarium proliferatum ET1]
MPLLCCAVLCCAIHGFILARLTASHFLTVNVCLLGMGFDQSRNRFYCKQSNPSISDFDESNGGSETAFFLNDSSENT